MRRALVALLATAVTLAGTTIAAAAAPAPGGPGIGDSYLPEYGNSGYDVSHYDIRLRYYPQTDRLTGTTTILASATAELSSFHLDFVLDVASVRVNNQLAGFAREGDHELVITPARPLAVGQQMTVVVRYSGVPSSKVAAGLTAWKRTPDGALAVGEPEIAWWWFPSNDHPADKATFDISVAVPDGVEVVSNGVLAALPTPEITGWKRWNWRSLHPQATYLAYLAIGQYDFSTDTAPNRQPVLNAYSRLLPPAIAAAARASVERTAEVLEWESTIFGPYPFESQGGVVAPPDKLDFALENQTRPVYSSAFFDNGADLSVIVHENAHQWFGDAVSLTQWKDIWLNEGFASYAEWLWSEKEGEGTAQEVFDYLYSVAPDAFWTVKPGDPGAKLIFSGAVYTRGAMTMQQLRVTVGDHIFGEILRAWVAEHKYGNGDTAQFIALAERLSGKPLANLFQTWLYTAAKPVLAAEPAAGSAALGRAAVAVPSAPRSWAQIRRTHALLAPR